MIIPSADRLQLFQEYFFSRKLKEITSLVEEGHPVINLGIGSPDLAPAPTVVEALHQSAVDPAHHGYQAYNGSVNLRRSIANFLERTYQVHFDPDTEILPLMGSKEGIFHLSMAFLNPGDTVLIPEVGYPAYRSVSLMVGAKVVEYPLTADWTPDWENIDVSDQPKILWLNYPHMPTGTPASKELFVEAVSWAKENNVLLCHDNPYSLVLNDNPLSIFAVEGAREVSLELNSLSKSHNMAGWRVGWISGAAAYLKNVLTIKSNIDSGMFRGLQDAAVEAMTLDESWHRERNSIYARRQKTAFDILHIVGCAYDKSQKGMFVWGRLPDNLPDADQWTTDVLRDKFVFITPGSLFGEKGKRYIRISLCSPEEKLREAFERLKK
ncbi:MAG: aminotransferase class I/II-fold pyridoxal phosphate-dependent enzyme [Cyclobacteriaceae bacterium]|nr:aminotransferase class I/II-fold pyridoxal phosphate-dependent enzyme [Cyclobacteriaceae bacterium]